ncbi:hypothetical protein [Companilactobacillus hulinensis]|uniref:hypothetical protein n=1 Tax=Companilactobacillus hulinensis TaxID=2486007 RepID=UPI0013DE1EF4|nr:hypothetical protein [Companilactobacillus hulinensis]
MLEGFFSDWPLYTLGIVLIALTSPWMSIAIMLVSLILIILAAVYRETHSWKYWKNMIITMLESVVLTIISTLGYTIPLIQRNEFFQASFKPMIQLSNFNLSNYYGGTQNLYLIYGAVALLLAVVVLWIPRSYLIYKLTAFGIMVSGILSTDLVPWKLFKHFDFSKITVYFWLIFSFLICLLISYLLTQLTENKSPLLKLIVLLLATIISCAVFYVNFPKQAGNMLNDTISSNDSMIVHYPKKSFDHQDNLKDFLVDGKLERVSYTTTSNFFEFKYYNSKSSTIDVPVIYSHGLNVQINNEDVKSTNTDRGTVKIKSQPGANIVQLRYQYSTLAKVAMGLSLLGWLLLLWVIINKGKWSIGKLINNS